MGTGRPKGALGSTVSRVNAPPHLVRSVSAPFCRRSKSTGPRRQPARKKTQVVSESASERTGKLPVPSDARLKRHLAFQIIFTSLSETLAQK